MPHAIVENVAFRRFISLLNPYYKLPTRKSISQSLVPELHNSIEIAVKDSVANSKFVSLSADGWTDLRKQAIVNVMVHLPFPLQYTSIDTGINSHTGMLYFLLNIQILLIQGKTYMFTLYCTDFKNPQLQPQLSRKQQQSRIYFKNKKCSIFMNFPNINKK